MPKKLVQDFLYGNETYLIRGACFKIWKEFGGAFKEKVVDRALGEELKSLGLKVDSQKSIGIYYRGKKIASYVPDKIINDAILIEVKCKPFLTKEDERQFWLYLKGSKYKLGLLINFGFRKLEIKRRIYDKAREKRFQRKSALLSTFIGFYIAITLLLSWCPASAQQNISPRLSVSPHTFDLTVLPGETRTGKIKVGNRSEVPLPILTKTVDFSAAGEEGEMAFDELSQDISFASRKWIKIENPNFILNPGETKEVYFTIQVPENAEPGGHYATFLFEPQLPSFYFEEPTPPSGEPFRLEPDLERTPVQPRVVPVIGVLFLFSVQTFTLEPETGEKLEVVEFSIPREERLASLENFFRVVSRSFSRGLALINQAYAAEPSKIEIVKKAPSSFVLRIKNNDIYHIKPSGKVLIYNFFGKKVGEAEIPQRTILPGQIRKFPVEFSPGIPEKLKWLPASVSNFLVQNFFVGKYGARIELQTKSPLTAEVFQPEIPVVLTFFSLPWHFWFSFIFISGLLFFLLVKYRKRIVLAMKTLLSPNPFFKIGQ